MDILSTKSLEKLRSECESEPELVEMDFKDLQKAFDLVMVPLEANVDSLVDLEFSDGKIHKDIENCQLLGKSLSELSVAEATDERLLDNSLF